jgi:hypothetical protein
MDEAVNTFDRGAALATSCSSLIDVDDAAEHDGELDTEDSSIARQICFAVLLDEVVRRSLLLLAANTHGYCVLCCVWYARSQCVRRISVESSKWSAVGGGRGR